MREQAAQQQQQKKHNSGESPTGTQDPRRPGPGPSPSLLSQLARPSLRYKRQTWVALLALLAFLGLYLALASWFAWTAYELTLGAGSGRDAFWGWIGGLCAAFLALLMFRALFFIKRGGGERLLELHPEEQPELFKFLHRLADKAGAPRPYKVFLSAEVNAAVFYDLSPLNLILPSRKNLVIGLGLVQALKLGEFRAVLAHEFGHFGQRAMAVGRWVYVAQQIARHLVVHRGKLDELLQRLSQWDLRIAWVGWALRLIVWSIRCIVESAYRAVDLLQRALSREMEMNADLVAVALTGSDALIHALYRLQAADDAWSRAMSFAYGEKQAGRRVSDLFVVQDKIQAQLGSLLQEPEHGQPPPLPEDPAQHRIFRPQMAQPPRMWQSHPPSHEREANAKRQYIHAPIDNRPAWQLFRDEAQLRARVTALALAEADGPDAAPAPGQEQAQGQLQSPADSLLRVQHQFEREHLDPRYRGIYFGRSPVRHTADAQELWRAMPGFDKSSLVDLYPASLSQDMVRLRLLETEQAQLLAVERGHLEAQGGVIRFRDQTLSRKALHIALRQVETELAELRESLRQQDLRVRSLHLAVAERLGQGWTEHLRGLITALHYGSHGEANLRDLQGLLQHTIRQTTATGKLSDAGRRRIVDAGNALHAALQRMAQDAPLVHLDAVLGEALGLERWTDAIGELKLLPATAENLGDWLEIVDSWVDQQAESCAALRRESLELLLRTEKLLLRQWLGQHNPGAAPGRSVWPREPDVLIDGQERPRDHRQSAWVRFQTADGWLPATARLLVAGGIVASVLGLGGQAMQAKVSIYNGLDRQLIVTLSSGESLRLAPGQHLLTKAPAHRQLRVETRTVDQALVERFEAPVQGTFDHHVYNIASAASLVEWTVLYGPGKPPPPTRLGTPRWRISPAHHLFEDPPQSIRTKSGSESRLVLSAAPLHQVRALLGALPPDASPEALIQTHARWDAADSSQITAWWQLLRDGPAAREILSQRRQDEPDELMWQRLQMDMADDASRADFCQQIGDKARQSPGHADLLYLSLRCLPEGEFKSRAFIDAAEAHPQHLWLAYAAAGAHAEQAHWSEAQAAWDLVSKRHAGLAAEVNVALARLSRWQAPDGGKALEARLQSLRRGSAELRQHLDLESGGEEGGPWAPAYAALSAGQLDRVLAQAPAPEGQSDPRLIRLIAASDGANGPMVHAALRLPPEEGLDAISYWPSLALALRERQGQQALMALMPKYLPQIQGQGGEQLRRFVEALEQRRPAAECEALLKGSPLVIRAQAMAMGAVVLGRNAPRSWRVGAQQLLFADERPFFQLR